jgi:DNA-binding response OmpR family regulator
MDAKHVLVVEDEPAQRALLEKTLRAAGYVVAGVAGGAPALSHVRDQRTDLVILDLLMPGIDGFGTLAMLKRNERFRAPVVVVSGRGTAKDIQAALDAGADAFLPKPVSRADLLAKVEELLGPGGAPK